MSIPIIKPFRRVECERHALVFDRVGDPSSGYALDCDEDGNIIGTEYRTKEECEAQAVQLLADPAFHQPRVRTSRWSYREPAIARCYCGQELELSNPLDNVCECGRCFNLSGQEVVPSWLCDAQGNPYEDYEP